VPPMPAQPSHPLVLAVKSQRILGLRQEATVLGNQFRAYHSWVSIQISKKVNECYGDISTVRRDARKMTTRIQ
jgi:hypothetical protein